MTKAFDCAVRLLGQREHGAFELSEKLDLQGFNSLEIKEALTSCQELGLQSDARYVECYCRYRIRQGFGPLKITQELRNKRLDMDLIKEGLSQENWLEQAMRVWKKKYKDKPRSVDDMQKQQRFLLYRGFSPEIVANVMRLHNKQI